MAIAVNELPAQLRSKGSVSDLVQQTFVKAVLRADQFRGQTVAELRAWLRSILKSESAVFRRHYFETDARNPKREVSLSDTEGFDCQTTDTTTSRVEHSSSISTAFGQLPLLYQQVVTLRLEHELTFVQIGLRIGKSEEACRKVFARAIDRLRGRVLDSTDECG